jgi:uncharacterized membrane protein
MKIFVASTYIILGIILLFLSACIPGVTSSNAQHLSPEQIKALADAKQNYLGCSMIGGPPLGGRSTMLIIPPNYPITVKFGPDCQILP